jgi:hypothetical protein
MMALANADAVGVDVNPRLAAIYRDRSAAGEMALSNSFMVRNHGTRRCAVPWEPDSIL